MITLDRSLHIPTISETPLAVGEILARSARRDRKRRRRWSIFARRKIHTARLSDREIVESNLPLR
jgi:hypothetical protein